MCEARDVVARLRVGPGKRTQRRCRLKELAEVNCRDEISESNQPSAAWILRVC